MVTPFDPEQKLRDMIAEGFSAMRLCLGTAVFFLVLSFLPWNNSDATGVCWMAVVIFLLMALALGAQSLSMRRRLNRKLREIGR